MYKVQSIIFDKKKFSLHLSKEWLKKHGYKNKGLDDTENFFHFRQFNPTSLKKQGYNLFRNKKLGKSGVELVIAYNECKCGGRILNEDLHHFIHSSYSHGKDYKNWKLDHELSDASVQVYFNGQDAVVVHRGSQDLQDWKENVMDTLNIKSRQPRLEHSRDIQKKAEEKYGANNVITIGHSKGARHAEEVGQKSREIYTLNKPVFPQDILSGRKVPEKQTDIRTTLDPVSILRPLQRGKKYQHILSKTLNPITEHSFFGDVLKRANPAKWWGKGINKKDVLNNYQEVLTHLTSHIGDPNEPIDPRDFQQSKKIINAIQKVKTGKGRCWNGYEPVSGKIPYSKGSCRKIGGANDQDQEEEPTYHHPEVPEPHFPTEDKIKNKEQFRKAMDNIYHLIRSRSEDTNLIIEIFDDLIDYTENNPNIHIVDLTRFLNLLKYIYQRVKNNNVKDRAKDILREYNMNLEGGGAGHGASILSPINPRIISLGNGVNEALRFVSLRHFNDQSALTDIQLHLTRLIDSLVNIQPLRDIDISYIIFLIEKIQSHPLLSLSFKRKLEPIKRQLNSALHLEGGRPCYNNDAVIPHDREEDIDMLDNPINIVPREVWYYKKWEEEFKNLKELWEKIFEGYYSNETTEEEVDDLLKSFFNLADDLKDNLSHMGFKGRLLEFLKKLKNNNIILNSHHYSRGIAELIREVEKYQWKKSGGLIGGKPCYNNNAVIEPEEIPHRNPRTRRWRETYRDAIRLNTEIRTRPDHQNNLHHINRFLTMVTELSNNFTDIHENRMISSLILQARNNPYLNINDETNQQLLHLNSIIHSIPEGAGFSGGGSGIITNQWNNTENELREILVNISHRPLTSTIPNNEKNKIVRLFNKLTEMVKKIREPYNNTRIPLNIYHEVVEKHRVILHLYNDYIRDNTRFNDRQHESFQPILNIINTYETEPHHLTPRDNEEPPEPNGGVINYDYRRDTISGRGRDFGLSYI